MLHGHDRIPEIALDWHLAGQGAALATVMATWGAAPRRVGSQMVVSADGAVMGSVSGGCVEGDVILSAQDALRDGQPRILEYGISDDTAFAQGLACGGKLQVLVEPIGAQPPAFAPELLAALVRARAARQAVACRTQPDSWQRSLLAADDPTVAARLRADLSGLDEDGALITLHNPPLRLFIVGAVHIAQALVPMARLAGYDVVVIDPRTAFASARRFPDVTLLHDWPDDALRAQHPDMRSALVTLSHDPKLDDPAILAALGTEAFYIGCLGSRRTHEKRLDRLRAAGMSDTALARIHAPVGLDLGAATPAEIAVATLAQITLALRGPRRAPPDHSARSAF